MATWTWQATTQTANWTVPSSWGTNGPFPNGIDEAVQFLPGSVVPVGIVGVDLTGNTITVGSIRFDEGSTKTFHIGNGTLAMQSSSGTATITLNNIGGSTANPDAYLSALQLDSNTTFQLNGALHTLAVEGAITGAGQLTLQGGGTLLLTGTGNTFTGGTSILNGVVKAGAANVLAGGTVALADTGTLDLNGFSQTIGFLTGDPVTLTNGTITNSSTTAATLTVNASDGNFLGVVAINDGAGQISLVKATTGRMETVAANSYSGSTLISGGTLALSNGGSIQNSSTVTVNSGATFDISDNFGPATIKDLTVNSGGNVVLGGQTLNVVETYVTAGSGTFLGSNGTDTVNFTIRPTSTSFSLGSALFNIWTDGTDKISITGNVSGNTIVGSTHADTLLGLAGNDSLSGGLGNDSIDGGLDNDTMFAQTSDGNDTFKGGDGFDVLDFSAVGGLVNVNQFAGTVAGSAGNDVLADVIEQIIGSNFNDVLAGGNGINVLDGNGGHDQLFGNGGQDLMRGGDGNDSFYASVNDGNDTLLGGNGFDVLDYSSLPGVVQVNQFAGTTTGTANNDTLSDVFEQVIGSAFGDVLAGGNGINGLIGGGGNDSLFGNGGQDYLRGGTGDDEITMGTGDDTLDMRAGDQLETILDFVAGGTEDSVNLHNYAALGFADFAGMLGSGQLTTVSGHAELALNGGDRIVFQNVADHNSLTAADFTF